MTQPQLQLIKTSEEVATRVPVSPDHLVRFYDNEHFLAAAVADFLFDAIDTGQPVLVIATESHRELFSTRLKAKGCDVDAACKCGQVKFADARQTLATFMSDGNPDAALFRASVGGLIDRALHHSSHTTLRAYGEMVDLLWKDGNIDGAIKLEELWNDLAATHQFTLLCAYAMGNFYKATHTRDLEAICHLHGRVTPTEAYTNGDSDRRLLEVTLLQQRARALEAEIEARKDLQRRLQELAADHFQLAAQMAENQRLLKEALTDRDRLRRAAVAGPTAPAAASDATQ